MRTSLAAFGDSFIYGHGLEDPARQSLPAQVGQQLNLAVSNHGEVGASLFDTIEQFRSWLHDSSVDHGQHMVLVGLTHGVRETFYTQDEKKIKPWPAYLHSPGQFVQNEPHMAWVEPLLEAYVKHLDLKRLENFRYWITTSLLANTCKVQGIPLLMFDIWSPDELIEPLPEMSSAPALLHWSNLPENRHWQLPDCHLVTQGYEQYSKFLTQDIMQRKLLEC